MSDLAPRAAAPLDRHRGWIAALAMAALLAVLAWCDVFAATLLQCQRRAGGSRCTVSETQLGVDRGTLVIADVQGAYVEDEGYDRPRPRLVLQGAGGDVPLPSSADWSDARRRAAAAQIDAFAGEGGAGALRFEERHALGRALAALAALLALCWAAWPRLRSPPSESVPDALEPAPPDALEPEASPARFDEPFSPSLSARLLGALLLRKAVYRDVGYAPETLVPALIIVVLSALVIGYADGLAGTPLEINGTSLAGSVANANLRALAAAAAALVSWPAAAVLTSWLAAGRGGVRTAELLRALGFANLFHLLGLLQFGGVLAWPLFFVATYVATRAVCSAGRLRSLFATWLGQGFAMMLAIPLWFAVMSLGTD